VENGWCTGPQFREEGGCRGEFSPLRSDADRVGSIG
jgi:hypothetical protein